MTDDLRRMHVAVLRAALRHADISLDTAARDAKRDVSQFRRQLEGLEGSFPSLWCQRREFWQWLAVEIAATFGVPKQLRRGAQLRRAAVRRKSMARMALGPRRARYGA